MSNVPGNPEPLPNRSSSSTEFPSSPRIPPERVVQIKHTPGWSAYTLDRATRIEGVPCGTSVTVSRDRWSCVLTEPFDNGGFTTRAGKELGFYRTNNQRASVEARSLVPPLEHLPVIHGVFCSRWAHLHPDGSIARCKLRKPLKLAGGDLLHDGTDAVFRPDGRLFELRIFEPHRLQGRSFPRGTVWFDAHGKIEEHAPDWFGRRRDWRERRAIGQE